MILRRWFWFMVASILLSATTAAANVSQIPIPARIGGTVTVDGTQLTQATAAGYTFKVTKQDGSAYVPAAESSGLNTLDWYVFDIPIYNASSQPGGANPGDAAVVHVYKDGKELTVSSPSGGQVTVGAEGSTTQIPLVAAKAQPQPIPTINEWGMILFMLLFVISAIYMLRRNRRLT